MDFSKLKECLDRLITNYNSPGFDCVVYKNHEKLFRYYSGKKDIEKNIPLNGNELYLIFSMTKMVTCVSALQLMERGLFSLDDKLSDYIPEFKSIKKIGENGLEDVKNPVLIKHLFSMSGGFDYNINASYIEECKNAGKTSTLDIVKALSNTPLLFEPGTNYQYSLCHDILGGLIEVVSGKRLSEYMKENIFNPLGMSETFFGLPKDVESLKRFPERYKYNEERKPEHLPLACPYIITDEYESGGAGLASKTEDYALFLDALASGGKTKDGYRLLKEETISLMNKNQLTPEGLLKFQTPLKAKGYGYGLGVRTHINKEESKSLSPLGEFGWDGAVGGFAITDTENKLSLTLLQHIHLWDHKIQNEIRNALYSVVLGDKNV